MSKSSKNIKSTKTVKKAVKDKSSEKNQTSNRLQENNEYLFSMSYAPSLETSLHWFQMLPVLFFTSVIVIITRMAAYDRPMSQFFWSSGNSNLTDFFSYYKMHAILASAVIALIILLYRVFTQSFYIKRSYAYIPMIIYMAFVALSYFLSDYKLFALWGWNERFEGTITLLCYMVMLFYIINTVNTEKNVKWVVYSLAVVSSLLGLLGLSQALNHDFFRTTIGKKLITPSWFWDQLDSLNFTFTDEIYQTVYNINYVSFYLTLLIPLFGLLFIRSVMLGKDEPIYKKLIWGVLFALLLFNLIGSASSGGLMGMAVVVVIAIIVLNRRIISWWKPIVILLAITIIVGGLSYDRWSPELGGAINSVMGSKETTNNNEKGNNENINSDFDAASITKHRIDYMITEGQNIKIGYNGEEVIFKTFADDPSVVEITNSEGAPLSAIPTEEASTYKIEDSRFDWISLKPGKDDKGNNYLILLTDEQEWPFLIDKNGVMYRTGAGNFIQLEKVPAIGWEDNQGFGSGRGYIWSRTLPMMKDTLVLGHGADTYCIYFPHNDYVGKYNADWNINLIVDKPHNMYMGIIIGTGGISMLALLVIWGIYIVQSLLIYRRESYESFSVYTGAGIFLGICGFLAAGLVNDSSVSVMPMFYGLLGTGICINMILSKTKLLG